MHASECKTIDVSSSRVANSRFWILILVFVLISLPLYGCGTTASIKTTKLGTGLAPSGNRNLDVVKAGFPVSRPYEILGVVSVIGEINKVTGPTYFRHEEPVRAKMVEEAAAMGADAMIGYYYEVGMPGSVVMDSFTCALAVKYVDVGEVPKKPAAPCVVAIPRVVFNSSAAGKGADNAEKVARSSARLALAKKGYYGVLAEESVPKTVSAEYFDSLDEETMSRFGGNDADLVLAIQFVERKKSSIVLVSSDATTVDLVLYSKSQKRCIWRGYGEKAVIAAGMINTLLLSQFQSEQAIVGAMLGACESLPAISTGAKAVTFSF